MEIHLWTGHYCVQYSQQGGAYLCITAACDSWVAEGNKSQRKLASSGCTLIHSILLSLCALFSPSPNSETLNLLSHIHQGPVEALMQRQECSRGTICTQDGGGLRGIPTAFFLLSVKKHTHTHKFPPQGLGSPTWSRHMEILHMIFSLIMWSRRRL